MPVRSINLKLIVPRGVHDDGSAAAIWTTHREVNTATCYYEELLLVMRQRSYLTDDGSVEQADVVTAAEKLLDCASHLNGHKPIADKAEALPLLRQLYEAMVPSSIGEEGNAQAVGAFVSPLTDPESKGFLSVFEKIENPPNWIEGVRDGLAEAFDAAYAWGQPSQL
jgi:hypothetical protein